MEIYDYCKICIAKPDDINERYKFCNVCMGFTLAKMNDIPEPLEFRKHVIKDN